jgi:glyoxylase-like metal-dependent hydrolase (beta-lactamase superfamily II)
MIPRLTHYPHGITAVDAQYVHAGLAAAHLIVEAGHAAIVDVGTNHSVPGVLAALDSLGIDREAVDFVFLTHVHLDHAGGAGVLMQALPSARAVVHPRGVAHLADPARLSRATIAVYGEENYRALYGQLEPVARERMVSMQDGMRVSLAGRELTLLDTPGHALHHYCLLDLAHANAFTGDTFGVSYRELDGPAGAFIVPATTPSQFDPDQLAASIERIMSYRPEAAFLMHYSRVTGLARLAASLQLQIREYVSIAARHAAAADRADRIKADMRAMWHRLAREQGVPASERRLDEVLGFDLDLNTQGLLAWLDRGARKPSA